MLTQIKTYWTQFKGWIIAGAIALAYIIGITKGTQNEKARQNKKILSNVQRANKARDSIADSATRRRLHDKYKR